MRLPALAAVFAFRAITILLLALGLGALAGLLAAIPLTGLTEHPWAARLPVSIATIGLIFLAGSVVSLIVMPRRAAAVRQLPPASVGLPAAVHVIAIGWCIAAALQLPRLADWFSANRLAVEAVVPTGPDPLGFRLLPAAVASALPALVTLAFLAFVVAAALVTLSRPELASRILASCAAVQGALVAGEYLVRGEMSTVLTGLLRVLEAHGLSTTQVSAWLAGNDATARRLEWWLIWMLGAAFAALLFSRASAPAAANRESPTANRDIQKALVQTAVGERPQPTAAPGRSATPSIDSPFSQSNYLVRPQISWNPFARRYSEYDVGSIPPMSSARCAFSWVTGRLTRPADGAVLLTVAPAEAPGLFFNRTYAVTDATGVPLGTLEPAGADWTIRFASGSPDVHVLRGDSGVAFARFLASREDREICRFTWTIQKTMVSAELEIEFLADADPSFRLLAIALAPILELRSRLRSERQNT